MKLIRIIAGTAAAAAAISSLPLTNSATIAPYAVFAEDSTALPDWVPTDLSTVIDFRNKYGSTHTEGGLICIVHDSGNPQLSPHFEVNGEYAEHDASYVFGASYELYPNADDSPYFMVSLYRPTESGTMTVSYKNDREQTDYTFETDADMNITETDIYSWLPDSADEYREYSLDNGAVSVNGSYVTFCLSYSSGTAYRWNVTDSGSEHFSLAAVSDCTALSADSFDGGEINTVYAYQAVKDGCDKISYEFGPSYSAAGNALETKTADCAVFNNAQNVLLSGQMRVTLEDYDTGRPIILKEGTMLSISTNIGYNTPSGEVSTGPILIMETNPSIVDNNIASFFDADSFSFGIDSYSLPKGYVLPENAERIGYYNGTIIPANSMTVTRFDNDSANVVFRLKFAPTGDINNDGDFNSADAVLMQKWLLAVPDTQLADWKSADLCNDDALNIYDLCLMKQKLIYG